MSAVLTRYVWDPLERALSSGVQQFVVFLSVSGAGALLTGQQWAGAFATAGYAVAVSLIMSVVTFQLPALSPYPDLAVRVVRTFGQSVLAVLAADQLNGSLVTADWRGAVAVAVPTALTALVKGLAAMSAPNTAPGASLLPAKP